MSERPGQQPKSQSSSSNSIGRTGNVNAVPVGGINNNGNFVNMTAQQQQQQSFRSSNNNSSTSNVSNNSNNMRPPQAQAFAGNNPMINRPSSSNNNNNNNNATNDFISFLNGNSANFSPQPNPGSSTNPGANANALSRLETIRQYYMQLSNNLRLITQQLQGPDLTAAKRQALLMEQARANAAMQEFTEKILKPISASKQQQQQAQQQAQLNAAQQQQVQQQQQQQQRPPAFNTQSAQMMNFQSRPPPQGNSVNNMKSSNVTGNTYNQLQHQQQQQRPPSNQMNSSVNLYSQSGLGMIRPIITNSGSTAGATSNVNRTAVNFRPGQIPANPLPVPQVTSASPQRSYRPPSAVNVPLSSMNTAGSTGGVTGGINANMTTGIYSSINMNQTSPPQLMHPPGTPQSSKASQQLIMNRQTYLMAAQQHQTTVSQQQMLFQQRLSLFARDNTTTINSPTTPINTRTKVKGAPVLALPPVSLHIPRTTPSSPQKGKASIAYSGLSSNLTKSSSFPSAYAVGPKLQELASNFNLQLDGEAEQVLLRIADEFIDGLARKSFAFASHRLQTSNNKKQRPMGTKRKSMSSSEDQQQQQQSVDLVLSVEDLILGLDEMTNYQPAGVGSIENCRPASKRTKENSTDTNGNTTNSSINTNSNHQHRMNMIKKHLSLYQYY